MTLNDTMMVGTYHYIFVKIHRMNGNINYALPGITICHFKVHWR